MADYDENGSTTNGQVFQGSYSFGAGSNSNFDMNGEVNMVDNMSSCNSSVISGSMDLGEEGIDPGSCGDDSSGEGGRSYAEGSCSREECVARIESTLRRNFKKIERRNPEAAVEERRRKERCSDVTQLQGYQPVPDNCPVWKKAMIEKKNAQLLDGAKQDLLAKKAEEEKWRDVPSWKRNLIMEKEKKRADIDAPTEVEKRKLEDENRRLESLPEWKRKLILNKRSDN